MSDETNDRQARLDAIMAAAKANAEANNAAIADKPKGRAPGTGSVLAQEILDALEVATMIPNVPVPTLEMKYSARKAIVDYVAANDPYKSFTWKITLGKTLANFKPGIVAADGKANPQNDYGTMFVKAIPRDVVGVTENTGNAPDAGPRAATVDDVQAVSDQLGIDVGAALLGTNDNVTPPAEKPPTTPTAPRGRRDAA